ncbi:hypothetical protein CC78DRAFT_615067 [Lojkania enalia]|uniref:FAD/NAD(P)-binding domain-containing protein n=1 Tax=Lojkania enalia TaxID=147567 RepID=A0A9P4KCN4_9PLEO|nr:hypothetical protein CC78DRAFT_615067 [Didymosphaeria enalia]
MAQGLSMRSVLIVGAGPAGLVAAKTLLRGPSKQRFKVTVFESADKVGGMWRAKLGEEGDKCSPDMRTNLSRFTVAFSDLPWQHVHLRSDQDTQSDNETPPMFPKAYQVGQYLESYAKRFIPEDAIVLNRAVTKTELVDSGPGRLRKWRVTSVDKTKNLLEEQHDTFDLLIVASGFFAQPYSQYDNESVSSPQLQHSSKFCNVDSLMRTSGNIAVIGGGISGSEAAATAAAQIYNARYSPIAIGQERPQWKDSTIYHVFNRPFYCLPRYLPQNPYDPSIQDFNLAPNFFPLDLVLYNLSRRGQGSISAANGLVPPDKAKKSHEFLRLELGGDQRDLCQFQLAYKPDQTIWPSFTGISDTYSEFVREGIIKPVRGRAKRINRSGSSEDYLEVYVEAEDPWKLSDEPMKMDNVTAIIGATGYKTNLDYLSKNVLEQLDYDSESFRIPILLSHGSVFHPNVPEIAFVGFYEGPYWGAMEMQANLVGYTWSRMSEEEPAARWPPVEEIQKDLRLAMKNHENNVPQFWMGDYVGFMEEWARQLGIPRNDETFGGQTGPIFSARYMGSAADAENDMLQETLQEVYNLLSDSEKKGRFVPAATFSAMQGVWNVLRKIDSRNAAAPGGRFKGKAHFYPRTPTEPSFSAEYLYIEEGTFIMDNGLSIPAARRYVYRYDEVRDRISAWFVKDDQVTVERIFNELEFEKPENKSQGWLAKGNHWCDPDTYRSSCEFRFRGASLKTFGITYEVIGPNKDYTMESWYTRP